MKIHWVKIKSIVKKNIKNLPGDGRVILSAYRVIFLLYGRCLAIIQSAFNSNSIINPDKIYWINPARIEYHTNYVGKNNKNSSNFKDNVFTNWKHRGKVIGGDWDNTPYKFEDLTVYKAFEKRIIEGVAWKETDFYKEVMIEIDAGKILWGCANKQEFDKRCDELDMLIKSMKEQGYILARSKGRVQLHDEKMGGLTDKGEEILVNIGRDGKYLFQDGRHRLTIAKILKIDKIPVKVLVRHKKWVEFRTFLVAMAQSKRGATRKATLYQPAMHPDLLDIPYAHGCEDRYQLIQEHISAKPEAQSTLLDIGANLGYFCHKFEDLGYRCLAIEIMPDIAWAADKIRMAEGKAFSVKTGDLFDIWASNNLGNTRFNLVLALNIFHHFLKTKDRYLQFKKLLNEMQVEVMIFEAHRYDESQMRDAYINYYNEDFADFILQNTSLRQKEVIGEMSDGRKIYKLYN